MKAIDQKSSICARPKSIGMYVAYILSQGTYLCLHLSIVTFFFPQTTNKMTKYPPLQNFRFLGRSKVAIIRCNFAGGQTSGEVSK